VSCLIERIKLNSYIRYSDSAENRLNTRYPILDKKLTSVHPYQFILSAAKIILVSIAILAGLSKLIERVSVHAYSCPSFEHTKKHFLCMITVASDTLVPQPLQYYFNYSPICTTPPSCSFKQWPRDNHFYGLF